jgi:hypothetical protein
MSMRKGEGNKKTIADYFKQMLNAKIQQQDHFKGQKIASVGTPKTPTEKQSILPGYYYKRLVVEFGIGILTVSQLASEVAPQLLRNILDKIFQEILEKQVLNKKEYTLSRLKEELARQEISE